MLERPKHSPLGASGAERWMNCPGSVALLKELDLPESDEPEYRKEGTAGHEAAAYALEKKLDGWEIVGLKFYDTEIDIEMADAVQEYLSFVRPIMEKADKVLIETGIQFEEDEDGYGTVDFAAVTNHILDVVDLKMGKGVVVEADTPQIKYYGYGILQKHPDVRKVRLTIVQPRAFHPDGPIRTIEMTADDLAEWAHSTLLPAMERTRFDNDLDAGKWCRFCPAKLVCPLMAGLFGAAMKIDPASVKTISNESLGRDYQYLDALYQLAKAYEEQAFVRMNAGQEVPGCKLVLKKANRVYKSGAEAVFKEKFGDLAYEQPSLKSPAQMSEISGEAKKLVNEYAYTPQTGLTVALLSDKRPAVKVEAAQKTFAGAAAALDTGTAAS